MDESGTKFACVLLAAGRSVRMGRTKQLLPWGASTIIEATLGHYLAAGLEKVSVIIGHDAERMRAVLNPYPVQVVFNEDFAQGMGTSLRTGMRHLPLDWDAVVIGLGDQPLLTSPIIRSILTAYATDRRPIAAPTYRGRRGHPVVVGRTFAGELEKLDGDVGCRDLLASHPHDVHEVQIDHPGIAFDIDTREDYERAMGARHGHAAQHLKLRGM